MKKIISSFVFLLAFLSFLHGGTTLTTNLGKIYYDEITTPGGWWGCGWLGPWDDLWGTSGQMNLLKQFCPATMVDNEGNLFTASFQYLNEDGLLLSLKKYSPNSTGNVNIAYRDAMKPWDPWCSVEQYGRHGINPYYVHANDETYFKQVGHIPFQWFIAKEVQPENQKSDYIYLFGFLPATRILTNSDANDKEGIMCFKINKSDLKISASHLTNSYNFDTTYTLFWNKQHKITNCSTIKLSPRFYDYHAFFDGNCIYWSTLLFPNECQNDSGGMTHFYIKYNPSFEGNCEETSGYVPNAAGWEPEQDVIFERAIRDGDYVYTTSLDGGYWIKLHRWNTAGNCKTILSAYPFMWANSLTSGATLAPFQHDFCILTNPHNNKKIFCTIGFKSGGSYSNLTTAYKWCSPYISWGQTKNCLYFQSILLKENSDLQQFSATDTPGVYPNNVLYVTDIDRGWGKTGRACEISDTNSEEKYRLYNCTHKICAYKKGNSNYIFYAYYYPGGGDGKIHFGYAPVNIRPDNGVDFLTKVDLSDLVKNIPFDKCTRIVSMDIKNGHLWLTWMNDTAPSAEPKFYVFHALVKNILGE